MILVCGEALFDVFPVREESDGLALRAVCGGSPFNVAVGLARLGKASAFFGGVSTDAFGEALMASLAREGVETRLVRRSSRPTPLVVVSANKAGSPSYAFHASGTADQDFAAEHLPSLEGVEAVALGSWPLTHPATAPVVMSLAARAKAAGAVVSVDPNLRPAMSGPFAPWRRTFADAARHATLIKFSDEDLAGWEGVDAESLAREWLAGGTALVVLTRGARGMTAWTRRLRFDAPAAPTTVADTVGAGDSVHAALLARLSQLGRLNPAGLGELDEGLLHDLLRYAAQAAAITCSRQGANMPRRGEMDLAMATVHG